MENSILKLKRDSSMQQKGEHMGGEKQKRDLFKIVVLDDDPTGIQTVHDVYVYTDWELSTLREAFQEKNRMFYILTNSRSFTVSQTEAVHRTIASRFLSVSQETGIPFFVILRGDSTLRGHWLFEPEIMEEVFQQEGKIKVDGEILCPAFFEGGRFTKNNIHYVEENGEWIPAAETEFAKDETFGYASSDLTEYVEEKTGGRVKAEDCITISTELLESEPEDQRLEMLLTGVQKNKKIIVNAVCYSQLERFCIAFWRAAERGKYFLIRSAASFVKAVSEMKAKPLLTAKELLSQQEKFIKHKNEYSKNGGLIIVGSHVSKTTRQLLKLEDSIYPYCFLEFHIDEMAKEQDLKRESERVRKLAEQALSWGRDTVIYTSRQVRLAQDKEKSLSLSVKISEFLTRIVERLQVRPSYLIAKGGITSSDIGIKGLKVRKAFVIGQAAPGISVWMTGEESRFPGLPYIIFPGNVGTDETLRQIADNLAIEKEANWKESIGGTKMSESNFEYF